MGSLFGRLLSAPWLRPLVPRRIGSASTVLRRGRFRELGPERSAGGFEILRWLATREGSKWEKETLPRSPRPPERVEGDAIRATWIGHATVLLQHRGLNLLVDPIWSERASPVPFAGPARVRPPGLSFEDLPPIDAVLISHDHYDHLDRRTIVRLARVHRPRFFVGLGTGARLASWGIEAREMRWWERCPLSDDVDLLCVPAQHFSGRGLLDRDATLWCGFVVEAPAGPIYFAGDTGLGDHFTAIYERLGPTRLALLPIGAWLPRSIMAPVHLSPEEAVHAHQLLRAETSLAIHHGTFRLADEGRDEAEAALRYEAARRGAHFLAIPVGATIELPAPPS